MPGADFTQVSQLLAIDLRRPIEHIYTRNQRLRIHRRAEQLNQARELPHFNKT